MDQQALLLTLRPWLRAEAGSLLGWEQRRHAEDFAQEAWIQIWRNLDQYPTGRPDELFIPWCKTVARRRIYYMIREMNAQKRGGSGEARNVAPRELLVDDVLAVWENTETVDGVEMAYHRGEILAALDALTPLQREYVYLRFWKGLSATELNAHFNTKNAAAGYWTERARPLLRGQLRHLTDALVASNS